MLRLIMQCAESLPLPAVGGDRIVAWPLIYGSLWKEVMEALPRSHGVESTLTKEVAALGAEVKDFLKEFEMRYEGDKFRKMTEEAWAILRARLDS